MSNLISRDKKQMRQHEVAVALVVSINGLLPIEFVRIHDYRGQDKQSNRNSATHLRAGNHVKSAQRKRKMSQTKVLRAIAGIASTMSVLMYVSYIPQIVGNLNGNPGDPIQPLVAMINCIFWTIHGLFGLDGHTRDKAILIANIPGIFFGGFAFLTAIMH